jgi:hypothetical protein
MRAFYKFLLSVVSAMTRCFFTYLTAPLKHLFTAAISLVSAYVSVLAVNLCEGLGDRVHARVSGAWQEREYPALALHLSLATLFWASGFGMVWAVGKTWRAGAKALDTQAPQDLVYGR